MQFKPPKNDSKYAWTNHVIDKMQYYGISESMIKRIVRNPQRTEEGIAEETIAVMQPQKITERSQGKPITWKEEIWVMYQQTSMKSTNLKSENLNPKFSHLISSSKKKIISAWRYPAMSPERTNISIPEDVMLELEKEGVWG